ncbi:MAG TPA: aldo/keto reductase [Tepidisphaeraceae bacterium]|nr:aldo/keto reductase [Tepidisphaeraceae bacterium]
MNYRPFGRTGWNVSEISFGAWAVGGAWGNVDDSESLAAMMRALDLGVNFFDTADVYGDGRSENLIRQLRKETKTQFYVATKAGRRLQPHTAEGYRDLTSFIERSLTNLGTQAIDLLQLHCPPTEVYYMPEVFDALDKLVASGKLRYYGVSVQKVEEAIKAMEIPNVASVQIIFNMFRQRPAEVFLPEAARRKVATIIRVPLASGMLTGKLSSKSTFTADDHRNFNRHGEAFDVGETFSGVDYDTGLAAVEEIKKAIPAGMTMAQAALRWILMFDGVSTVIPGAKSPRQVEDNCSASSLAPLNHPAMATIREIYNSRIRGLVHQKW